MICLIRMTIARYFEEEEEEDATFIICKIMYIFQIMEQKASSGK